MIGPPNVKPGWLRLNGGSFGCPVAKVLRVQPLVAEKVVDIPVKLIRPAFRDDVDDATGGASELGVISVSVDLEFLHRLLADGRAHAVADDVVIVHAIDLDGVGARVLT